MLNLNVDDPLHLELIQSTANIYATMLNIPIEKDVLQIKKIALKCELKTDFGKNAKIKV